MLRNGQEGEDGAKFKTHLRHLMRRLCHQSGESKQYRTVPLARHKISLPLNLILPAPETTGEFVPQQLVHASETEKHPDTIQQVGNRIGPVLDNSLCPVSPSNSSSCSSCLFSPLERPQPQASSIISMVELHELRSTSYTVTSPLFRHGVIRIDSSLATNLSDLLGEEQLDWVAFQIALSGVMGNPQEDGFMLEPDTHEDMVDSIVKWWAGFGFPGYGQLVWEPNHIKDPGKAQSSDEDKCPTIAPSCHTDSVPFIQDWDQDAKTAIRLDLIPGRLEVEDDQVSRISVSSLPLSPMDDMPFNRNYKDFIPMGFNLMHDLWVI